MSDRNIRKTEGAPKRAGKKYLAWGVFAILLVVLGWVVSSYLSRPVPPQPAEDAIVENQLLPREMTLYFAVKDASHLVGEAREVPGCMAEEDCLRAAVEALIAGPSGALDPVLPDKTLLLGVQVEGSLVTLDFSEDLVNGHPGGTQSELLTVYALTDTLAVNFPHLRQVRILVEGEPIDTLKGHVDLRQPVSADFRMVKEMSSPAGDLSNIPARSE